MWICLNDAFLSIVRDPQNNDNLLVRARDAESIPKVFGNVYHIEVGGGTDYTYRTRIPRGEVMLAIGQEINDIYYGNFKNSVKDRELHDLYLDMWFETLKYQEKKSGVTYVSNPIVTHNFNPIVTHESNPIVTHERK